MISSSVAGRGAVVAGGFFRDEVDGRAPKDIDVFVPAGRGWSELCDELAGVLNWMIDGLRSLQANNMQFPGDGLGELTREIVEESNKVIEFLRETCEPGGEVKSGELYAAYEKWCFDTRHKPVSSTRFPRDLIAAARHFGKEVKKDRRVTGAVFSGVRLSTTPGGWEK